MTFVQRQNPVGQLLSSNGMLTANNRNVAARFLDGAEQTVANLNYAIRPTTVQLNTAPSLFVNGSGEVVVAKAGIYQINWSVSARMVSGTGSLRVRLVNNFVDILGCDNYMPLQTDTLSMLWLGEFHLEAGDSIAVFMDRWSGSDNITLPAFGCRIGFQCLYQLGDA